MKASGIAGLLLGYVAPHRDRGHDLAVRVVHGCRADPQPHRGAVRHSVEHLLVGDLLAPGGAHDRSLGTLVLAPVWTQDLTLERVEVEVRRSAEGVLRHPLRVA